MAGSEAVVWENRELEFHLTETDLASWLRSVVMRCVVGLGADPRTGVRPDFRLVILRYRDGTCGAAWIGVNQALAWCGEWCGLPSPDCRHSAFSLVTRIKSLRTPNKSGL